MSTADDLAAAQEAERKTRERKTATNAALLELMRSGGAMPSRSGLAKFAEERLDGSRATFRDPGQTNQAGGTNHNDHLTQSYTPTETSREDT